MSAKVIVEPTEPGWYAYSGGNQNMIFRRTTQGDWFAIFDNGDVGLCSWGYIEQALGVWDLIKIELPRG